MLRSITASLLAAVASSAAATSAHADVTSHGPVLRVTPSALDTYVARGTLPLPPGEVWQPHCPFGLRRAGVVLPAQWWPVAYHADGTVAVVELAAKVPGEASLPVDPEPIEFEIVVSDPPFAFTAPQTDLGIVELATVMNRLRLDVEDSLGNRFSASVSRPIPSSEVEVLGRAKVVYVTDGLLLKQSGPTAELPYLGGFRAWFTVHDGGRVAELDLRWHNAVLNEGGPMIPDVLFEGIDLVLPDGWSATPRWALPTAGAQTQQLESGQPVNVFPLIADGPTPHLLRQRGNLTWRLVLHRDGDLAEVADVLDRRGWGTVRGTDGGWQDPAAASWLAQRMVLPDLSPWELALAAELRDDRAAIEHAFSTGEPYFYGGGVGALGPYHTYGVTYGGMTSGSEIYQAPGTDLLWTAENDGLAAYEARHRMVADRQFGWFYNPHGTLVDAFALVDGSNALPMEMFSNDFSLGWQKSSLGFEEAPDVYAGVQPRPDYEEVLLGTTPWDSLEQHDAQHGARATYAQKVLVWAANDRLARHDLIGQAAVWHMELHDGPDGRLTDLANWASDNPHVAGEFGRGEAWIVDAVATWYAIADAETRAKLGPWLTEVAMVARDLETPLGVVYGNRAGKITDYWDFDGQYAIVQWYEHSIVLAALTALRESWAPTPDLKDALESTIVRGALAMWKAGWKPGTTGPWEQQAVAWMDPELPAFATPAEIPADGFGGGSDNDQAAAPLSYAARYADGTASADLFAAAQALVGAPDPLTALEGTQTYWLNLPNRAPLIAWLQAIGE